MPLVRSSLAEVWCLGVGDGMPCPGRRRSSYLYTLADRSLLIDCGEGCSESLNTAGISGEQIDHVLISHLHSDHVSSFSLLFQDLWLAKRRKPLSVAAPARAVETLQDWLCHTLLFPGLMPFRTHWKPLHAGQPFRDGPVKITPYPTRHLASLAAAFAKKHPATCFDAFSFLIEAGDKRVVHTADIGHEDDLDPLLARPVDLLVCELAHVEPEKIFAKLRGKDIGQAVFIHLPDRYWQNRTALKKQIRQALGPLPFRIAKDGEKVSF